MRVINDSNILTGQGLLNRLNEEDWRVLIPKLHYYSLNKLQRFSQLEERFNIRNLATYFADEAIKQLWTGERSWNTSYYPEVFQFLAGAVDSLRSNFLRSKEVTLTEPLPEEDDVHLVYTGQDPEKRLISKELENYVRHLFEEDPEASEIFEGLRSGSKPREMALEMHVPVKTIYNGLKRIERKLAGLKNHLKTEQ